MAESSTVPVDGKALWQEAWPLLQIRRRGPLCSPKALNPALRRSGRSPQPLYPLPEQRQIRGAAAPSELPDRVHEPLRRLRKVREVALDGSEGEREGGRRIQGRWKLWQPHRHGDRHCLVKKSLLPFSLLPISSSRS
jgi:hypothetical protein